MNKIRIPIAMLQQIINDINKVMPDQIPVSWNHITWGGNTLRATRVTGARKDNTTFDSIDFEYDEHD